MNPKNCIIIDEYKLKDGLYFVPILSGKPIGNIAANLTDARNMNLIEEWHLKLGYPHYNRIAKLSEQDNDVPSLDPHALRE